MRLLLLPFSLIFFQKSHSLLSFFHNLSHHFILYLEKESTITLMYTSSCILQELSMPIAAVNVSPTYTATKKDTNKPTTTAKGHKLKSPHKPRIDIRFGGRGLRFRRYGYLSKTAKFPFWGMDYSPWSWKNSIDRNRLKKFMQVGIDVKCMYTNFGGRGLPGFGDKN